MRRKQDNVNQQSLQALGKLLLGKIDPSLLGIGSTKIVDFLEHVGSSAPRAKTESGEPVSRWQDALIEKEIGKGASVLDLGCGNGKLLERLMREKNVFGQGIELDLAQVFECVERGVPVFQGDLDAGLKGFGDASFDYVILEETLQTLKRPDLMLGEMLRVGRKGIVSFPNFAYWRVRLDLTVRGRMPITEWLPYKWYDTPNIHLFALNDFLDWAEAAAVVIDRGFVLSEGEVRELRGDDNLHAEEVLLVLKKR
jgi:methionine biosynthesis protein MetW